MPDLTPACPFSSHVWKVWRATVPAVCSHSHHHLDFKVERDKQKAIESFPSGLSHCGQALVCFLFSLPREPSLCDEVAFH